MSGTSTAGGEQGDIQLEGSESNKISWAGEAGETEESDTNRKEDREEEMIIEEPAAQEEEENVEMARGDWPADSEGERRECCDLSDCCNII